MIPTTNEVTRYVNWKFEQLLNFSNEKFGINLSKDRFIFKLTFNIMNRDGCAGKKFGIPYMKLNIGKIVSYEVLGFDEYKAFADSSKIGAFKTSDWRLYLDGLMCHEFAHVVQNAIPKIDDSAKPHGRVFQSIYRIFREKFVNHLVSDIGRRVACSFRVTENSPKIPSKVVKNHPMVGKFVSFRGITYTVTGYNSSKRKYKFEVKSHTDGKTYNMCEFTVARHKIDRYTIAA